MLRAYGLRRQGQESDASIRAKAAAAAAELEVAHQQGDSLTEEAMSEVLQDLEAPYRPNISAYNETAAQPKYSAADTFEVRLQAIEKEYELHPSDSIPAFKRLDIFSGQDERFAFRRAVSRIYELDSAEYIHSAKHVPLPDRTWETPFKAVAYQKAIQLNTAEEESKADKDDTPGYKLDPSMIRTRYPDGLPQGDHQYEVKRSRKRGKQDPLADVNPFDYEAPTIKDTHIWGVVSSAFCCSM